MHLLVAAAGSGRRVGADRNKLLLPVAGHPVLAWTVAAALQSRRIHWIGIIGQPHDRQAILTILHALKPHCPIHWIDGGQSRQDSVERGLAGLPADARHVLIHDGARCLVAAQLFDRCGDAVVHRGAVIAAIPVTDTIKRVSSNQQVQDTIDRSRLWAAQTPQGFPVDQLRQAHRLARERQLAVTDDAALFEALGWPVAVETGSPRNFKITTRFDLELAALLLQSPGGSQGPATCTPAR